MGYQIEPAADSDKRPEARMAPDGVALTKRLDDGLHQVYEGTIRKAALISQRDWSKWKDAAGSLPEDNLRDHILSHNLDELFELAPAGIGGTPAVRVNERRTYEIEQTIKEEIAPGRLAGLGVVIKGVDIKTLEYPPKLKTAIIESMSSNKRAFGQAEAIQRIGNVKTDAIQDLFEGILNLIAAHMPYADQEIVRHLVGVLQTTYQEALTDDVLAKDFLEANSDAIQKLAESDGPKHLTAGMFPDPSHVGKRHSGNGRP